MEYKFIKILFIALIVFGVSACTSNYIYTSRGSLEYATESGTVSTKSSVIYWRMDKGRLVDPSYSERDSGISLRICERGTKSLEPDAKGKTEDLVLLGKNGDLKVAEIDVMGEVSVLDIAVPIKPQNKDICGKFITTDSDGNSLLMEGANPEFIFICNNLVKVNRYPMAKKYSFGAVKKVEYIDEKSAPKACVNQ